VQVTSERVDGLPLLLAQLKGVRVPELLNELFPTHGNWQGLSPGHLVIGLVALHHGDDHRED